MLRSVICCIFGSAMIHDPKELITVDQAILGGCPVFRGTRVPVGSLISHLEKGITVDEFLSDFPSVSKEQATSLLELVGALFSAEKITKLYEAAA